MKVVLYAKPGCPMCKMLKGKLVEKKIDFELIEDEAITVAKGLELGIKSAPILKVDDKYLMVKEALDFIKGVTING